MTLKFVKPTPISLKDRATYDEVWVEERNKEDPSILGLGEIEVRERQRTQPKGERLDMLLQDPEEDKRYVVELMLGELDASHIVRTLEYWDTERKRYPRYDHVAVIVAEYLGRFQNVVTLLNSLLPLVVIKMSAYEHDGAILLTFNTVLEEVVPGLDDSAVEGPTADRSYWEQRSTKEIMGVVDSCFELIQHVDTSEQLKLKYNKYYIVTADKLGSKTYITLRPRKHLLRIQAATSNPSDWSSRVEAAGLVVLPKKAEQNRIEFQITSKDVKQHAGLLSELFKHSFDSTYGES